MCGKQSCEETRHFFSLETGTLAGSVDIGGGLYSASILSDVSFI
jgi:hypothetical protein